MMNDIDEDLATLYANIRFSRPVVYSYEADMTKYDFLFTPLGSLMWVGNARDTVMRSCTNEFVLVTLLNFGTSYQFKLLNRNEFIHWTYVAEKLKLQQGDAKNVSDFLQRLISVAQHEDV